jgi:hypothetical protein
MKRLASFLVLAAFCLGIFGVKVGRPDVRAEICGTTQSCPQFSSYLACDDFTAKPDLAKQPFTLHDTFVFSPELSCSTFLSWNFPTPASATHYGWLGLGCGGLPS